MPPEPVEARIRDRLGLDLFVVVAAVLVVLRLLDRSPWTPWVLDMHTYWATRDGFSYVEGDPYTIGAYLYAPAFAQLLSPITALPGSAADWRRAATFAVSPSVTARGSAAPTIPTATSPVLMPTLALKSEIPQAASTSRA